MSVLIKNMGMPTSCTMCWLNTFCGVWNIETAKHKGFNKRLDDCPLAELIQCKDCKYNPKTSYTGCPMAGCMSRTDEWYCPVGKPKENEK